MDISDLNGFSKEDNMLVLGVPELIEKLAGSDARRVIITYKRKEFYGSIKLSLVRSDYMGSTYEYLINEESYKCWLCPVFYWYFNTAPNEIYIEVKNISDRNR